MRRIGLSLAILFFSCASLGTIENDPLDINYKRAGLLVASSKGVGQSAFGHAYLRLSVNEIWSDSDLTVEFVADQKGEPVDLWKGLGLDGSYSFTMMLGKYRDIRYEMNNVEDRTLTTYLLKISDRQLNDLVRAIKNKRASIQSQNYNFISQNCASQVSQVLKEANILDPSKISNVPSHLSKNIRSIVKEDEITQDHSASFQRTQLVETDFKETFDSISENSLFANVRSMLKSEIYDDRLLAVLKLIKFRNALRLKPSHVPKLKAFLLLYVLLEKRGSYLELLKLIKNPDSPSTQLVPLSNSISDLNVPPAGQVVGEFQHSLFIAKDSSPELRITYKRSVNSGRNQESQAQATINVPIASYGFSIRGRGLYFKNSRVANWIDSNIFETKMIGDGVLFLSEVFSTNRKRFIATYAVIEEEGLNEQRLKGLKDRRELTIDDVLPFLNNFSFRSPGNCLSMIMLVSRIQERVVFLPDEPRLQEAQYFELIENVLNDRFVLIPGFKNLRDFSENLNQDKLKRLIDDYSYRINIEGYGNLMIKFFTREPLTNQKVLDLGVAFDLGLQIPIRFKTMRDSEHALLVFGFKDMGSFYSLAVYDPNLGVLQAGDQENPFRFDKESNLLTSGNLYTTGGTTVFVDKMDIRLNLLFKNQQSGTNIDRLIKSSRKTGQYTYSIKDLMSAH